MKIDMYDPLAVADHDTIMKQEGYFAGYYGIASIEDVADDIKSKLGEDLKRSKGAFVTIYSNDFLDSERLDEIMGRIEEMMDRDANIVFLSEVDDGISAGDVGYEVLLSGLN
jgi:cell division GTPase FtsZ